LGLGLGLGLGRGCGHAPSGLLASKPIWSPELRARMSPGEG
jgi:hypothetical protein